MSAIFISHSNHDRAAVSKVKTWLEQHSHRSLFLDFDPDVGIEAGARWETALFDKLGRCQVVLALVSDHWSASKWCFAELVQAREQGKLIILASISAHESNSFSDLQHIDLSCDDPAEYRKLERALSNVFDWDSSRPPYPGLLAFQEQDAAFFFGRDTEIDAAQQRLESLRRHRQTGVRFLLILGASGSGKSSVVRAGLLPRLGRAPERWLPMKPFQPREQPLVELALSLAHGHDDGSWQTVLDKLEQDSRTDPPDGRALGDLVRNRLAEAGHPDATVLLVIDQAEELFVANNSHAAGHFLRLIRSALNNADGRLIVLATMRSEFLGAFQTHPFLNDLAYPEPFRYRELTVDPLPVTRIKEVITGPAERVGLRVQDELVGRLVSDTVTGEALPLLAFTLRSLWERRGSDELLELQDYEQLGGLAGAIESAADEALELANRNTAEIDALRTAFVPGLVRVNAEGARVRRRAFRDDLPQEAEAQLARFVDARLLVSDRDENGRETLEVAHEALLRAWQRLAQWIDRDQDNLRALEALRRAGEEWDGSGQRDDLLVHRNGRLADALTIARGGRFAPVVGRAARDYLEACVHAQVARERAEREEQQRRLRDAERIAQEQLEKLDAQRQTIKRTLIGGGLAAVFAVAAVSAAWLATRASAEAELQRNLALAQQLAAQGELLVQTGQLDDAQLGALLVVEALRRAPDTFSGQLALASVLSYFPPLVTEIGYKAVSMSNSGAPLAFSEDGRYFTASIQGQSDPHSLTRMWSLETGEELYTLIDTDKVVKAVALSPKGRMLATAGSGESVDIWQASDGEHQLALDAGGPMQAVVFSPDGKLLAAARDQGSSAVKIYLMPLGHAKQGIDHVTGDVVAMDFGPNGRFLATVGWHSQIEENVTQIWDLKDGHAAVDRDHYLDSATVAYSYSGEMMAAAGGSRVEIWRLRTSEYPEQSVLERALLAERDMSGVSSLAFSPDDSLLAIGGNRLTLWDFRADRESAAFEHDAVLKVAFVKTGRYLASASRDVMRLWDLGRGPELERTLQVERAPVLGSEMEDLLAVICERVARRMTEDEWSEYVPDKPVPSPCMTTIAD